MSSEDLNAVVMQRIEVAPGLAILRIVPDGWDLPEFTSGQYGVLGLPGKAKRCAICDAESAADAVDPDKLIKRAYSIASSSVEGEYIEFYVALVPSGALTPRLFALKPGDKIWLAPKMKGLFTLQDAPADKNIVLISTGTGLAPYMSMLRSEFTCKGRTSRDSDGESGGDKGYKRRFAVLHGARHSWDLGYRSELRTLERLCNNFTYVPIISRPDEEPTIWGGASGYVQSLWELNVLNDEWEITVSPDNTHVFLCGNPAMIEGMLIILQAQGYVEHKKKSPGNIHVEKYW